jgi:hypothetical protein
MVYRRQGRKAVHFLNLDVRWREVVTLMLQSVYRYGKRFHCPLNGKLGWPLHCPGKMVKRKIPVPNNN